MTAALIVAAVILAGNVALVARCLIRYAHEQGRLLAVDRAAVGLVLGAVLVLAVVVIGVIHGGETTCAADVRTGCYR